MTKPVPIRPAWLRPVSGPITSGFGDTRSYGRHEGIDFGAPVGSPVRAARQGRVNRVGNDPDGYGLFVEIIHPGGLRTLYGHMSKINVQPGQTIRTGQPVGAVGSTGNSTGPHLHFSVISPSGQFINPLAGLSDLARTVLQRPARGRPARGRAVTRADKTVTIRAPRITGEPGRGEKIPLRIGPDPKDVAQDVLDSIVDLLEPLIIPGTGLLIGVILILAGGIGLTRSAGVLGE